jgi:hypothetical protein
MSFESFKLQFDRGGYRVPVKRYQPVACLFVRFKLETSVAVSQTRVGYM